MIKYLLKTEYKTVLAITLSLGIQQGIAQTPIIFDTDFGGDADDLGALAMLNHFQNKKEIDLLAIMCWNRETYAVSAIDAVNTYYGNPDVPIGFVGGAVTHTDWNHNKVLAENLPYDASYEAVPNSTELYRKLLSEADDHRVKIVTVGPLLNIKNLLESEADDHSPLNGKELVAQKVQEFIIMGGQFPEGSRKEWNFDGNMPGVTQFVLAEIPVPITYLGYEIGVNLRTGEVFNSLDKNSPLYLGFYHFSKYAPWMKHQFKGEIYDNATYDQTAVLYAVRGGVDTYWSRIGNGICVPDHEGRNTWKNDPSAQQSYLVLDWPKARMEEALENFMLGKF